jgi:hypothetical protein
VASQPTAHRSDRHLRGRSSCSNSPFRTQDTTISWDWNHMLSPRTTARTRRNIGGIQKPLRQAIRSNGPSPNGGIGSRTRLWCLLRQGDFERVTHEVKCLIAGDVPIEVLGSALSNRRLSRWLPRSRSRLGLACARPPRAAPRAGDRTRRVRCRRARRRAHYAVAVSAGIGTSCAARACRASRCLSGAKTRSGRV